MLLFFKSVLVKCLEMILERYLEISTCCNVWFNCGICFRLEKIPYFPIFQVWAFFFLLSWHRTSVTAKTSCRIFPPQTLQQKFQTFEFPRFVKEWVNNWIVFLNSLFFLMVSVGQCLICIKFHAYIYMALNLTLR